MVVDDRQAPDLWLLDPRRMGQVLTNLLRNALDGEPTEGSAEPSVEATVGVDDGCLLFEVREHGPGITEEQGARIFEPFHTTRVRGTGLGLAITRRIVHLHEGMVAGANHLDGGAVFRVIIPPGVAETDRTREPTA